MARANDAPEIALYLKMASSAGNGMDPEGSTPEAYAAKIASDIASWSATVKAAGVKL